MELGNFMKKHVKSIIFIVLVLSLGGIFSSLQLPVSLFPNIQFPRIAVSAEAGDMPADRMMITVTRKLEESVNSIQDVVNVRSATSLGASELSINFHWNIDVVKAELLVNNAINQIRSDLPPNFKFTVRRMNPTVFPIIGYSLTSGTKSLIELRNYAEYTLRPILTGIDGVAKVIVLGGRTSEYLVEVNPERLRSYGLSMTDLIDQIQKSNIIEAAGRIEQNYKLYLTLVNGQYSDVNDIGKTIIKVKGQNPVFLNDVATITKSVRPEWTRVTSNGKDAVLLNIYQQPGGNTVKIDNAIKSKLESMQGKIPAGINISKFYDQSELIIESMNNVRDSIFIGILLAMGILFLFLRNWKITLIASLDVPITIAITILVMKFFNMSFNIMTLGGLAAAIGLIIDDAIVIVENIIRHLAMKKDNPKDIVGNSIKEIFSAILGSSFSTIVVFAPLAFLTGVTGAFFKSLSLTMAISLFVSMFLSIFFIPILSQRYITEKDAEKQEKEGKFLTAVYHYYEKSINFLFRRKIWTYIIALILVFSAYFFYNHLQSGFMPEMDEGAFILDYHTAPGTSLQETDRVLRQIGTIINSIPEVASYSRRTGIQLGGGLTEANMGDFLVRLKNKRSRGIQDIISEVRSRVHKTVPGIEIEFAQLMGDLIGDLTAVPQPIEVKIFGDDYTQIDSTSKQVVRLLENVSGVVDIYNGVTIAGSSIMLDVKPLYAGIYGLTAKDIYQQVQAAVEGNVASEIQGKLYMTGIRVQYPLNDRKNIQRLKQMRILTPKGTYVKLSSVADVTILEGQPELTRENLKQMIAVSARLSGRDLGSAMGEIKQVITKNIQLPSGVFIQYGGLYAEQQKSFKGLLVVLIMAILLVFSVQMIEFESFKIPIIILTLALLSLSGVFFLLWLTNVALNISSMMGMIMIIGIVGENAIFLIHYIQLFRKEGMGLKDALIEAGKVRLRPIFMTTFAAVLALMPLALGIGAGAQMQQPLAIAVIGGFSLSAFLLLLLLPIFYFTAFNKRK
jgi:CzcA family heavy metal efflux pump